MNILSNYYNYYNQIYQLNSLSNSQGSTEDSSSSENETKAISSTRTRAYIPSGESSLADLNYNGRTVMNSLKMQGTDSSEIFQNMDKIKKDIDSIKSADIDSMSADEIKETLTNLKTDMQSMPPAPDGQPVDIFSIDIGNMSESDMKDMLEKIQEKANSIPDQNQSTKTSSVFSKIQEDMDSIKTLDIDSMSADELKEILTDLTADMKSVSTPYGRPSSANVDLDNMSESDMKTILKKIQEQANSMPAIDEFDPVL